jgi:hypothetical protein
MILRKLLQGLLVVCFLAAPSLARAATTSEVINGAACSPYPPYTSTSGVPYQHWLWFNQVAYCQLTMSDEWPVQNLSYVLFNVNVGGVLTGRLCVHSGDFSVACGDPRTISAGYAVNWVLPRSPFPEWATGAYMQFTTTPSSQLSTILQVIPVWNK